MVDKISVNMNFVIVQLHSSRLFSLYGLINLLLSFVQKVSPKVGTRNWMLFDQWWGEGKARPIWVEVKGWNGNKWMYLSLRSGWIGRRMSDDDEVMDLIPWLCLSQSVHNFPNGW
jgi:hypothetical protein